MPAALQNFTNMGAQHGFSVVATGKFKQSNTGLTALLQGVALVDPADPSTALGTASNPLVVSGGGGGGGSSAPYAVTPLGYQQITSLASSTALTVPATTTFATVEAETVDVRYRDDGVAPTAGVGMILFAGVPTTFGGAAELAALRFINTSGGTAKLNISYYK